MIIPNLKTPIWLWTDLHCPSEDPSQIMSRETNLFVADFKPLQGNYLHWALYHQDGQDDTLYEVVNETPNFTKNTAKEKPEATNRLREKLFISTILARDVPRFEDIVDNATVDNETTHWNCQDYVLEIIEVLASECIVDEEEESYLEAVRYLKEQNGAMI